MSSDGAHIYALDNNTLSTIDTATNTATGSVTLGGSTQWTDLVAS
jgi:YVTN family beta-propeller protein